MKTISEAAREHALRYAPVLWEEQAIAYFEAGAEVAQSWIDVNKELPQPGDDVICKVINLSWVDSQYAVGHLKEDTPNKVWVIEGRHCSHYKDAANNCVTHWRPIELSK